MAPRGLAASPDPGLGGCHRVERWSLSPDAARELAAATRGFGRHEGGFIERYLVPVIYPPGLDRDLQVVLAVLLLMTNAAIYVLVLRFLRGAHR